MVQQVSELLVRIVGSCCLIDPRDTKDPFGKRVVLPADIHMRKHIAYIEFRAADFDRIEGALNVSQPYTRNNVSYRRVEMDERWAVMLDGVRGEFHIPSDPDDTYNVHVPPMSKVCTTLRTHPKTICFQPMPPDEEGSPPFEIAAVFDIIAGQLSVTSFDDGETTFLPPDFCKWGPAKLAHWVGVTVPVTTWPPLITMLRGGGAKAVIHLKTSANEITLGNQPIGDITGDNPTTNPTEHFRMFYQLADEGTLPHDPNKLPLPHPGPDFTVNGCSPTNWP